jgi:ankyrin repeat protein
MRPVSRSKRKSARFLSQSTVNLAGMDASVQNVDAVADADLVIEGATELGIKLITTILERAPFDIVKALVDAGAPLWFQDDEGVSALHAAAYVEDEELVKHLLEQGAVWNAGECSLCCAQFEVAQCLQLSVSPMQLTICTTVPETLLCL